MNKIILIGNGFDLAHGLKTSYEDFIYWYWKQCGYNLLHCSEKEMSDGLCSFKVKDRENAFSWAMAFQGWRYQRDNPFVKWNEIDALNTAVNDRDYCDFSIISPLFQRICKQMSLGWVDIENEYYSMLVEYKGMKGELEKLNKDLAVIQGLLVKYLNEIQTKEINEELVNDDIKSKMLAPLRKKEIAVSSESYWTYFVHDRADINGINKMSYILHDYGKYGMDIENLRKILNKNQTKLFLGDVEDNEADVFLLPDRIMLLNFNYTKTADLYMPDNPRFVVNHIHGELSNSGSVIFGYGDESDDEYRAIVKQNDNEYLKHIKTNRYLETTNYRELLSFINSDAYQVCIMGHSCGNSDRTLLNTLFEHRNCVSVKPYYYISKDGKDNYLDIIQNISRNFTDMKLMRDRVVNKVFCEPFITYKESQEQCSQNCKKPLLGVLVKHLTNE